MRAILKVTSDSGPEKLIELLKLCNFIPTNLEIADQKAVEIAGKIAVDDRDNAVKTRVCSILESGSLTWGMVSNEVGNVYIFRMFHKHSPNIQSAMSNLVRNLRTEGPKVGASISIDSRLDVKEDEDSDSVMQGFVVDSAFWRVAIGERRLEWYLSCTFAFLTVVIFIVSVPGAVQNSVFGESGVGAGIGWIGEVMARFVTAFSVAFLTTFSQVFFHWRQLRRDYPIRWSRID